ncbi:chemotaxis protein CheA [Comamonas sp. NLF-1-9]|uniref:chemotaxis protein CheA n=1 Tax=Comamonas sp. NLF-1-9 TaxID=2853163 RepID=UPI001C463628|nr:chemotaxis protein CheW [Comamonas sp. NLF-1-9]QXL84276.1 chemotaxis protein CheW [Comamonas sp. NLF-1-9]
MADTHAQTGAAGSDFDLSQFYGVFFEEAAENLDQMEQMLLALDVNAPDDEELNGIFRCAHSIKGGSATFGFADVAELTHKMESLLDRLRRHELQLTPPMVDALLESADVSRSLLARHQGGEQGAAVPTAELVARIRALAEGAAPPPAAAAPAAPVPPAAAQASPAPAPVAAPKPAPAPAAAAGERALQIRIGPLAQPELADAIKDLFRDIEGLGSIEDLPSDEPGVRVYAVKTRSSDAELLDLFVFHVAREQVQIREAGAPAVAQPGGAGEREEFGFFEGAPGAPHAGGAPVPAAAASAAAPAAPKAPTAGSPASQHKAAAHSAIESSSIRVAVNKVDQLINLVGELVITQAMLAQNSRDLDPALHQQLLAGLADLDRNTRDLQESVMSIRMIPMSTVFSRFPRMLRDLAKQLGKKVEFVTHGEATELDKSLVEKITDPLTHLVRNSCDHGIELPAERLAAGKTEHGTLTLSAAHQGGSIVIEVRDDGHGLSREKILKKARERGLDAPDSMPDAEVWNLIMLPGFSTAEVVTDVSGRGVGMDVVKKNIAALNGTVEIDSVEGAGTRVSVRLPLTLAIMDGMSVGVADEVYILPLSSVVESFQVKHEDINTVAQGSQLVKVREEYMPVVSLERIFQVPRAEPGGGNDIMVVIEAEGSRVAVLVDELLGQQQVVVKNLETNYRKVANVSGATIMGDGNVALILDTSALVRRARH